LPETLAVLRSAMPRRCSATGGSDVARRGAPNSRRLIHFHMKAQRGCETTTHVSILVRSTPTLHSPVRGHT
jgi:hypothetical protein